MEDLPMKAPKRTVRKPRTVGKKKPAPNPPCKGEQQPRDRLGRFARKTGHILWAGAKAAGSAVVGTAKTVKRAHRTIKRVRSSARQRSALELRERKVAIAEREHRLGLRKKKIIRRSKSGMRPLPAQWSMIV
jgi:hypothetical protein